MGVGTGLSESIVVPQLSTSVGVKIDGQIRTDQNWSESSRKQENLTALYLTVQKVDERFQFLDHLHQFG